MGLIENAFPYCDPSMKAKYAKESAKFVRVMTKHCSLKCDGFSDLVDSRPQFKSKAESCVGDEWLFNKINSVKSTQHDFTHHTPQQSSTSTNTVTSLSPDLGKKEQGTLPKRRRDLTASSEANCLSNYTQLFSNAMRPVPTYSNQRFGSVVSDPSSFLHWGLVHTVAQCLKACDETQGCVFVNVYQQSFNLDNPNVNFEQFDLVTSATQHAKKEGAKSKRDGLEEKQGEGGEGDEADGRRRRKLFARKSEIKKNSFVQGQLSCALYSRCHLECEANRASGGREPVFFERSSGYCKSKACADSGGGGVGGIGAHSQPKAEA